MKSRRSAITVAVLTIVFSLAVAAGATYALFGNTFGRTVEVTSGELSATVKFENDVKTFSMDKTMSGDAFELGGTAKLDGENKLVLEDVMPGDKATVTLTVTNTSPMKIKYRVSVVFEGELGSALAVTANVNPETAWTELEKGGTVQIKVSVELPKTADNTYMGKSGSGKITVDIGQGNATDEDLNEAFGSNK